MDYEANKLCTLMDFFILDFRINLKLQRLTIPSVIPNVRHYVESFILDLRITNVKSRLVIKFIQIDGTLGMYNDIQMQPYFMSISPSLLD